jgi:DNA-binding GntR family transcriptional regulator
MPGLLPATDRILRTQLHGEVIRKLNGLILRGDLAPGSHVQERALCEHLGISRTPLREALKVLASRGLVELRMNRGARIAPLRAVDVAEAFEVLALLERRAGELVAARLDDAGVRELCRLHRTMIGYSRRHCGEALLRVDLQIHRTIVESAGNRTLATTHEALAIKVERARYLAAISPQRVRYSVQEHEVILEAILARNPGQIADALYDHCLKTRDAVVTAVMACSAEDSASEAA